MLVGPDERALAEDLAGAAFRMGEAEGRWGRVQGSVERDSQWPFALFWVAAARRASAPDRFVMRLDCAGYPVSAPTGTFWDSAQGTMLVVSARPKGVERVGRVFRTDWNGGQAFYHPYDRATADHPGWPAQYPAVVWHRSRTVVDYLTMVHTLLNSQEYQGV